MSLTNQWWSIEDWATAHGMSLDDALGEGISQNDDDTIDIPENYRWRPLLAANEYYDTVDVELYLSCEEPAKITEIVNFLLDEESAFRQRFWEETRGMDYDEEHTKFMLGKQAWFMYLEFIQGRESEFGYMLSRKFPTVNIVIESTDIHRNYWAENIFYGGKWTVNRELEYSEKSPDVYREYLEEIAKQ